MDKPGRSPETMSFLEHLDELRRRLIISLIAVLVAFGLCFTFAQQIFDFLMGPLRSALPPGGELIATAVPEIFLLYLKMAFFAGIFLASPVVLTQVWLFVAPGLYRRERKYAVPFVVFGTGFFLGRRHLRALRHIPLCLEFPDLLRWRGDRRPAHSVTGVFFL